MIPKMFTKENAYNYYSSFPNNYSNVNNNMGLDYVNHKFIAKPNPVAEHISHGTNVDSMMLVHRRKMQRRAANRRSAQLSRARKKVNSDQYR